MKHGVKRTVTRRDLIKSAGAVAAAGSLGAIMSRPLYAAVSASTSM